MSTLQLFSLSVSPPAIHGRRDFRLPALSSKTDKIFFAKSNKFRVLEPGLSRKTRLSDANKLSGPNGGRSAIHGADESAINEPRRPDPASRPRRGATLSRERPTVRSAFSSSSSSSGSVASDLVELPLFPLPLVLFPGSNLPLQIFEYRYRILMQTLLQSDMRFGIIYAGKETGTAATIGCVGEVVRYEKLVDDRFFMVCRGQERFRIVDIVRRRPYLVAKVTWLEDKPSDRPQDLNALSDEVEQLLKGVIRLSNKMKGAEASASANDIRRSAFPTPFSFWVASMFESAPSEQQALLELEDTGLRLEREQETLRNTLNYLTAAAAVKEAFPDQ